MERNNLESSVAKSIESEIDDRVNAMTVYFVSNFEEKICNAFFVCLKTDNKKANNHENKAIIELLKNIIFESTYDDGSIACSFLKDWANIDINDTHYYPDYVVDLAHKAVGHIFDKQKKE